MLCRPTTDKVNPMSIQYRLNVTRPMGEWTETERQSEEQAGHEHDDSRLEEKELRTVHKHCPQVDPRGMERRKPPGSLVV